MALVFFAYPLAIYVSLCLLPRGQAALGIALAAVALGGVWVMSNPANDEGYTRLLVTLGAIPVALAALAQGLRRLIRPDSPTWFWPALAAGVALTATAVFLSML